MNEMRSDSEPDGLSWSERLFHDSEMTTALLRVTAGAAMVIAQVSGRLDDPYGVFSLALVTATTYAVGALATTSVHFVRRQSYPGKLATALTTLDNSIILGLVALTGGVSSLLVAVLLLVTTTTAARYGVKTAIWWAGVDSIVLFGIAAFAAGVGSRSDRLYLAGWWSWLLLGGAVIAGITARAAFEYRAALAAESHRSSLERYERLLAERAQQELETAAADRRDFLRVVTHELRTPITSIGALSRAIASDPDGISDPERSEMVGLIRGHAQHLQDLLDGVRDLAVTKRSLANPTRLADIDLRAVVLASTSAAGLEPDRLTTTIHEQLDSMQSDPEKLRRILTNLIENAARHSRELVEVSAEPEEGFVVIEVRDRGPGLSPEVAGHVFEKGFSFASERDSSGLGLWIVSELVVGLAGDIRAVPRTRGGLTMRVRLPHVLNSSDLGAESTGLGASQFGD